MRGAVYVNGTLTAANDAVVPVYDHGFVYGEGVYETLRTYNGVPFLYDRHALRLRKSAGHLALDVPFDDGWLLARVEDTIKAAASAEREAAAAGTEWYIRILLTRGVGELTYDITATPSPSLVVIVKPLEEPPERIAREGINISLVGVLRNHPRSVNPIIKSNNLLNNALGSQEAFRRGAFEGVMRNYRGEIAECTTANIFIVKDGVASTPPLEAGLLAGITREFLFEVAREVGVPMREQALHDADLFGADEAFLTSTTREVVPIVRVDDRVIGSGKPGPITTQLLAGFRARTRAEVRT
jgi:branched-chain amino acid aminotransferase